MNRIHKDYIKWMYNLVTDNEKDTAHCNYKALIGSLYHIPFRYSLPMDANRESDGINLRYRFGRDTGIPSARIASELDVYSCSVLEMMVALAIRMEEEIMCDPAIGSRSSKWFWEMIDSMGLSHMRDGSYDSYEVDIRVNRMLDRKTSFDGRGGLFTIEDTKTDLRNVEIWYQMSWYVGKLLS